MLIALDVFGTLADTTSVTDELVPLCGGAASAVAIRWRARQLEYMFRATAMQQFPTFADLTRWGLLAALGEAGIPEPEDAEIRRLASAYRRLAPYPEVDEALASLRAAGHQVVAFSVGPHDWLDDLTRSYRHLIARIVSAEDAGVYKPHPGIYQHLLRVTGKDASEVLLVSSNPFDIVGGAAVGLRTAWCRRDPSALFDPWGTRPDHIVPGLLGLCDLRLTA